MTLTQSILARAAFDHDAHTAIAHKILALCGPVYGPLDALMKAQHDENARLTPLITRLVDEVEALKAALKMYASLSGPAMHWPDHDLYSRLEQPAIEALAAHQKRWEDLK